MPINRSYGWVRDTPDHRDEIFVPRLVVPGLVGPEASWQPPSAWTLEHQMPPIWNQGQLGSCQPHATGAIGSYIELREGQPYVKPSILALYFWARAMEGTPNEDSGSMVRDGIKVIAQYGLPPDAVLPYSDANPGPFTNPPGPNVVEEARRHLGLAYRRIVIGTPGYPMRAAICSGLPIAFGFNVPAQFEDPSWDPASVYLPLPTATTQIVGGHAVVVVAYDFTCTRFAVPVFKVRNSWGADWGEAGHFYMDYRWFDRAGQNASDLWVISKVS